MRLLLYFICPMFLTMGIVFSIEVYAVPQSRIDMCQFLTDNIRQLESELMYEEIKQLHRIRLSDFLDHLRGQYYYYDCTKFSTLIK